MNESDYQEEELSNTAPQTTRGPQDFLRWFLRRFWIFLICALGGYFYGLFIFTNTPETFRSSATIEIRRVKQDAADVDEEERIRMTGVGELLSASEKLKMPSIYAEIARSHLFSEREDVLPKLFKLPWEEDMSVSSKEINPAVLGGMMRSWVTVSWREDTTLLDIYGTHSDPTIARDIVIALLSEYERAIESKVAGSSEYALDYILENSTVIKEKLLGLEKANRLYNRCIELSEEIRNSERSISEMEKRYLPRWPALVEAKELGRILNERFGKELQQVLRSSADEAKFWQVNQQVLVGLVGEDLINAQIQLASTRASVLEREIEVEQQMYDNLTTKLKEGNLSAGFATKQFEVLQNPYLPTSPIAPVKKKLITKFVLAGSAIGIGLIFLMGFLDPTVRTVADLEVLTGIPVIGAMPGAKKLGRSSALMLQADPNSQATEAVRTLRAGLTFLGDSSERCTFLVTSAVPGEGKSFVAANLASSFATQGDRTLLIDADLRRPVQHEIFGYSQKSVGLADYLSLGKSFKEVIKRTEFSENMFVMSAGSYSANPSELLAGKNLPGLLAKLSEYFDRIIIDSAPLIPVADTLPIAKLAQSVVLVCRIGKTPRTAIKRAVRTLKDNASYPVGVVANGLPIARTKGGYGYYYSYYGGGGSYSNYSSVEPSDDDETPKEEGTSDLGKLEGVERNASE